MVECAGRYRCLAVIAMTTLVLLVPARLAPAKDDGIGVGMGFDVEYIAPQRFRDPGGKTRAWFPVKFVCGETPPAGRLVEGTYGTLINVVNLSKFKVRIGWWFSPGSGKQGVAGAQAEIPSHGSLSMDCAFIIRNLRALGIEVGSFVEGFVTFEDLNKTGPETTPTRVAAVYSSLHKQVHNLPDLVPVPTDGNYCRLDAQGRLVVTIRNQGETPATASTTRIAFEAGDAFDRLTPPLAVGMEASLAPVPLPRGEGRFVFAITADVSGAIREMNEANNTVIGSCLILR